jgi:tRNA(adenine34) deaminase
MGACVPLSCAADGRPSAEIRVFGYNPSEERMERVRAARLLRAVPEDSRPDNRRECVGSPNDVDFMVRALGLAQRAAEENEVPVGALLVMGREVIGEGWNRPIASCDPTAHAEIVALRAGAGRMGNYRLGASTLYVTLEPCAMCMGAVLNARVSRVVFGAWDHKAGACGSVIDLSREPRLANGVDVFGGVCSEESTAMLRRFFESRR